MAAFIFVVVVHAHLATVLTELLCKLQSEAGLGLLAYSLGEVVRRKQILGWPTWKMQGLLLIYIYIYVHCMLCICIFTETCGLKASSLLTVNTLCGLECSDVLILIPPKYPLYDSMIT